MADLALAIALGATMGSALGLVGTGGAILAVPALVYLFDFPALQATTASLVIVIAAALVSARIRARAKQVDYRKALTLWSIGIIGNAVGAIASKSAEMYIRLMIPSSSLLKQRSCRSWKKILIGSVPM